MTTANNLVPSLADRKGIRTLAGTRVCAHKIRNAGNILLLSQFGSTGQPEIVAFNSWEQGIDLLASNTCNVAIFPKKQIDELGKKNLRIIGELNRYRATLGTNSLATPLVVALDDSEKAKTYQGEQASDC